MQIHQQKNEGKESFGYVFYRPSDIKCSIALVLTKSKYFSILLTAVLC